ncbi:MAG: porin [Williamsia sp.]|nr:porin [Williamsia sp.]
MKNLVAVISLLIAGAAQAQDSVAVKTRPLTVSGYIEAYYSYDLNRPANNQRPPFLYNYNRHNEVNLNLGFVKAAYNTERVRANLAVAAGTYMNANYAAESGTLRNIYEANAGYKLSTKADWWLDIGIMPSHIGFESAAGKDNWALTRSMVAGNSPYFESGARLSYTTKDGKLMIAGLALNGWQRINRLENNSLLSYGTQVYYKPLDKITLNYSTFTGTDKPDHARLWRTYHNLYGIFRFNSVVGLTLGIDIGTEQKGVRSHDHNNWYTPVGILRITPAEKWAVALRGEYFSDKQGVVVSTGTPHGFQTGGASLNVDYLPLQNVALRLEGRTFSSKDRIFVKTNGLTSANTALTFSTAISFQ